MNCVTVRCETSLKNLGTQEKITPYFVKLAKISKSDSNLDVIHNGDGQHFSTSKERNDYIVNFFCEIYKKPACEPENLSGCIQDFLGEDICRHPVVKNSILTTAERDKLEAPPIFPIFKRHPVKI